MQVLLAEFTREAHERDQLMKTLLSNLETELTNAQVVNHARLTKQQIQDVKILNFIYCSLDMNSERAINTKSKYKEIRVTYYEKKPKHPPTNSPQN